ncbi:MAG: peptide/nickel transport system permease protein [Mycobacterium sp.]|jgi:peptide/nickel transport system permease protein|nr:peptide/nickel transport system permease protein [Mycobacterium sp.]
MSVVTEAVDAGRSLLRANRSRADGPGTAETDAPKPQWRLAVRAFSRDKMAVVSLIILVLVALAAIFAPLLTPYSPVAGDPVERLAGVGTDGHFLGLDGQGRDIWTRLLYGGRNSLMVAVVPVLVVFPLALLIGLFAGFQRSRAGETLMRVLDVLFAFPLVLLAIALSAVLGAGLGNVMLAIGITLIPYMARVAYTATVQESSKDYLEAARAYGANPLLLMFRELMPNVVVQLLVYATTLCGLMIVVAAGLSFLGVGVIPPTPDWGIMTADGKNVLLEGIYHVATIPGLLILVVSLAFNLIGDGVRDALDPRKQTS